MRIDDLNRIIAQKNNGFASSQNQSKAPNLKKILGKRVNLKKSNVLKNLPRLFSKFDETGSFKHSGDIGDLIYGLPVIRYLGYSDIYLNPRGLSTKKIDGSPSGFNENTIKLLTPLLESQPYIRKVLHWNDNPVIVDMDYFRKVEVGILNLCEKILYSFSVPFSETNMPWISVAEKKVAPFVFARSFRYRNDDMDYCKFIDHKNDCIFVGLEEEHKDFCERFTEIPYYPVKNLLELAEVINGSEVFYGNQSSPMAIAISMHKKIVQESFKSHPDCVFDQKNAVYIK